MQAESDSVFHYGIELQGLNEIPSPRIGLAFRLLWDKLKYDIISIHIELRFFSLHEHSNPTK
jgi:hypothetical protein